MPLEAIPWEKRRAYLEMMHLLVRPNEARVARISDWRGDALLIRRGQKDRVMSQNWIVANLTPLRGSSGSEVRRVSDAARGDRDLGGGWQPR